MTFNNPGNFSLVLVAKAAVVGLLWWLADLGLKAIKRIRGARDERGANELARGQAIFAEIIKNPRNLSPATPLAVDPAPKDSRREPKSLGIPPRSPGLRSVSSLRNIGAKAKLSDEELNFLRSQRIPISELFDAAGLKRARYTQEMNQSGQRFAYGTKPCAKGHSLRTHAGHCIQCDTSRIAFALRHHIPGHVYVAGSASTKLLKVGTTTDLADREKKLREHGYGGARDWEMLLSAKVENAGSVEFASQEKLRRFSVAGTYIRDGRVQNCYELFQCGYDDARDALISSLPPGSATRAANERRSRQVWSS